jgi:hypothetical protein
MMRRVRAIVVIELVLGLVVGLAPAMAWPAGGMHAVVRKPNVGVYAAPQAGAAVIGALGRDAGVEVRQQSGLWYEVGLQDGRTGYVRVNDLRLDSAATGDAPASLAPLLGARAGGGRVTETAGVRGIDESELRTAAADPAQLAAMEGNRVDPAAASAQARRQGWQETRVAYAAEAKPAQAGGDAVAAASGVADAAQQLGGAVGALGQGMGSLFGRAKPALPKPEQEQLQEELALGPLVAGRVLGARPLWADAGAQKRVNLVGRWVASQTSRPELPWTFGVIDTPELNAYAAPGGYVLVTRGLYELLATDEELAAVLGHEIGHCVQRDHYNVVRKQQLATLGKDELARRIATGAGSGAALARRYVEDNGAAILVTSLDREAEFSADQAAEVYLARSGMNPIAFYSVLQKMASRGEGSASLAALYKTHPPLAARLDRIDQRGYAGLEAYTGRP